MYRLGLALDSNKAFLNKDPGCADDVFKEVQPLDILDLSLRTVLGVMQELYESSRDFDSVILTSELEEHGLLDGVGGKPL